MATYHPLPLPQPKNGLSLRCLARFMALELVPLPAEHELPAAVMMADAFADRPNAGTGTRPTTGTVMFLRSSGGFHLSTWCNMFGIINQPILVISLHLFSDLEKAHGVEMS